MSSRMPLFWKLSDRQRDLFEKVFAAHWLPMLGLIRVRRKPALRSQVDSSEVGVSAFVKVVIKHDEYGDLRPAQLARLVRQVTLGKLRDHEDKAWRRGGGRHQSLAPTDSGCPCEPPGREPDPSEEVARKDLLARFAEAEGEEAGRVLELRLDGMSTREIADVIASTRHTVRRTLERAERWLSRQTQAPIPPPED
jgi:DNA-directed RNA polymerase specialized sigma24 family protein